MSGSSSAFRAVLILGLLFVAMPALGELTPQQKQFLGQIDARLKQAQANLKSAEESAGTADKPATGSRANLALSRSGSALAQIKTVKDALAKLPADDPAVKAIADQAAATEKSLTALEARLTGGAAPMAAPVGAKLDYKQEKVLKDTQYYLAEVQGMAGGLEKLVAEVVAAKDADRLDHRLLGSGMATAEKAVGRKKIMDDYLAQLPKDGAGVAQTADEVAKAMARVDAASKTLAPVHARLMKIVDPASYPTLTADIARMQGLAQMYADPQVFERFPEQAAEIVGQSGAAKEEHARFVKAYDLLVAQGTEHGKRCQGVAAYFAEKYNAFTTAAAAKKAALPAEIKANIDEANKLAETAIAEKKPAFFADGGGVPQRLGWAKSKVVLLSSLDADAGKAADKSLADTQAAMKQKLASLREDIITQNPLPPDRYTAADRQAIVDRAVAAWKQTQPDAVVMMVRIPSDAWSRDAMWRLENRTWYLIDRSRLQAQVIVKHDDKLAVIRPVNLWIDHVAGDKQTAFPMDDLKAELEPSRYIQVEKVK
ncbi:hypothetical protein [Humisphaera borealis]|uniref:Uncharacterized protein n=1 Tax=Humisphaera borealis TaxID=2807512 RepID=A0A7M2X2N9_9BACT|nr:hypothetical protein [Humisphaera borealis]QOV91692.1 hypothetical protein IPV69_10140 [Humisphaera borealis]